MYFTVPTIWYPKPRLPLEKKVPNRVLHIYWFGKPDDLLKWSNIVLMKDNNKNYTNITEKSLKKIKEVDRFMKCGAKIIGNSISGRFKPLILICWTKKFLFINIYKNLICKIIALENRKRLSKPSITLCLSTIVSQWKHHFVF